MKRNRICNNRHRHDRWTVSNVSPQTIAIVLWLCSGQPCRTFVEPFSGRQTLAQLSVHQRHELRRPSSTRFIATKNITETVSTSTSSHVATHQPTDRKSTRLYNRLRRQGKSEHAELLKEKFKTAQREKKQLKLELAQLRKDIRAVAEENAKLRLTLGDSAISNFQLKYLEAENKRLEAELKDTVERASAFFQESRRDDHDFDEREGAIDNGIPFNTSMSESGYLAYGPYYNDTVSADLDSIETETTGSTSRIRLSHKSIWKRRNAKSAQEGIRREKLPQLSTLLEKAKALDVQSPRYAARTIAGLVSALAEEVDDLDVEVVARPDTPFWDKSVDEVKITFSRLGFKPLKMGGLDKVIKNYQGRYPNSSKSEFSKKLRSLDCADEAFKQIDVDNSGYLDQEEIGKALALAAGATEEADEAIIEELASELLVMYDANGDGVVDREEYQRMVEDMAALSKEDDSDIDSKPEIPTDAPVESPHKLGAWGKVSGFVSNFFPRKDQRESAVATVETIANAADTIVDAAETIVDAAEDVSLEIAEELGQTTINVTESDVIGSVANSVGSITLSGLKLDLRRLVFGAVPVIKRITPGGPLILEPFTVTIEGSFNRDDIMTSPLLEDALSRLISMVLRRRVRSVRDTLDLAVLFGRGYKLTSKNAPFTQITDLTNVEFDSKNRLIMTGRAKVRTRPGAPTIEQAFKVRAKLGTRKNGRFIRLEEPELAFVVECPKQLEDNFSKMYKSFGMVAPPKPQPLYTFIPIYSPFKVDDNDGFDLGEDNAIKKIYIEGGALRFELSAVLRPGRFLGSHYIAFTLPIRTFIITLDRVKEGMRAARKAKQKKQEEAKLQSQITGLKKVDPSGLRKKQQQRKKINIFNGPKSFFSRFVDGYMQAEREEPEVPTAIRDFFGKQSNSSAITNAKNMDADELDPTAIPDSNVTKTTLD